GTLEPNWQQKFNPDNTIPNELIVPTFLTNKINLWYDPVLSQDAIEWADQTAAHLPEIFFLCQPYSFASVTKRKHWGHW
ncbi:hypothetical protein, partial [Streptomyces turgidiscabies]|uniref:hypothetical protein n=1 Tax=Streptomyces turgidiscabies TaxID=85558 RepID=UPI0038F773E6